MRHPLVFRIDQQGGAADLLRGPQAPASGGHKKLSTEAVALKGFAHRKAREAEPADIMAAKVETRHFGNAVEIHLGRTQRVVTEDGFAVCVIDSHIGL